MTPWVSTPVVTTVQERAGGTAVWMISAVGQSRTRSAPTPIRAPCAIRRETTSHDPAPLQSMEAPPGHEAAGQDHSTDIGLPQFSSDSWVQGVADKESEMNGGWSF